MQQSYITQTRLFLDGFHSRTTNYSRNQAIGGPNLILQGTIPSYGAGIQIGQFTELCRSFSQEDINAFGTLIGDFNPVHFPSAQQSSDITDGRHEKDAIQHADADADTRPLVHGILLSSLFSTIFGTLIPGCIYRSQTLKFHHPVYVNEMVCGRVLVRKLRQIDRSRSDGGGVLCTCDTAVIKVQMNPNTDAEVDNQKIICVDGEAQVWLPGATILQYTMEDQMA